MGCERSSVYIKTDDAIVGAFYELLATRGFEKITVSDIIKRAGVNRSTFYRHYVDKYAILDSIKEIASPFGDEMIAPLTDENHHVFDVLFNGDFLREAFPESFKRVFMILLRVRTESFDMEQITKDGFAHQYKPEDASFEAQLQREIYADICYRLLIHSLTDPDRMKETNIYSTLRSLMEHLTSGEEK